MVHPPLNPVNGASSEIIDNEEDSAIRILHISDLHIDDKSQAEQYKMQLFTDLDTALHINHLDFLVISGDIGNTSIETEYSAAAGMIQGIMGKYGVDEDNIILVPGNHDLNWDLADDAYDTYRKGKVIPKHEPERCIDLGEKGSRICDEDKYRNRFENFKNFLYDRLFKKSYPLNYEDQILFESYHDKKILFLGFNSSWNIDFEFLIRSGIHRDAITKAIGLLQNGSYDGWLKIAVFHHSVSGQEMMNDEFMQLLTRHKFQIVLHGHIHKPKEGFYKYDDKSGIHIIGAGCFGKPSRSDATSIPLQYNLINFYPKKSEIKVQTRRKEQPDGAWEADSRWVDKDDPKPYYYKKIPNFQNEPEISGGKKIEEPPIILPPEEEITKKVINIPLDRNRAFVGRENYLTDIEENFFSSPNIPVQILFGHPGIGKTQIALEYAYRYEEKYNYIWWIYSEDNTALALHFNNIGKDLNLLGNLENDIKINRDLVKNWMQKNNGWLIIFDNVISYHDIKEYIPPRIKGHILISSRNHRWQETGYQPNKIEQLPRDKSIELLEKKSGYSDNYWADKIANELEDIPLSLSQAGAYISETRCGLKGYFTLLSESSYDILKISPHDSWYPHSVVKTIEITTEKLLKDSRNAMELMYLFSFFAPDNIPLNILKNGREYMPESLRNIFSNTISLNKELSILLSYSLIERNGDLVSVHRLVQNIIRTGLIQDKDLFLKWINDIIKILDSLIDTDQNDPQTRLSSIQLAPHISIAVTYIVAENLMTTFLSRFLTSSGNLLRDLAQYHDAKNCYEGALQIDEKVYGPEHSDIATDLNYLGLVLRDLGDYQGAKLKIERALQIDEKVYGPEHSDIATDLNYLGLVLRDLGDYQGAKLKIERALAIYEKLYEPEHPSVATTIGNLGAVLQDLGDYQGAKLKLERALAIDEKLYGPEHPSVATTLGNLGLVLKDLGDYQGAKLKIERALAISEKVYGPEHPSVATNLGNLGMVLKDLGDYQGAKLKIERALAISEKVYGPEHPSVATNLGNLGMVLKDQGDYQGAKLKLERALAIDEKVYGPEHPSVATNLVNLGMVLKNQGDYQGAKLKLERALAIDEKVYGSEHPSVATDLNNLGMVLRDLGDYKGAKLKLERALAIDEKVYGPEHPSVATNLNNLGTVLQDLGDYQGAKLNLERALQIDEKVYGPEHPYVAIDLDNLGTIIHNLRDFDGAKKHIKRALQIDEKIFGLNHPDVARDVNNLGKVLYQLKEFDTAKQCFNRALKIDEKVFEPDHPKVITIKNNLTADSQEKIKFIR